MQFVVDGNWVTDPTAPQANDASGYLNNVLTTDRIAKPSTTTAIPLESSKVPEVVKKSQEEAGFSPEASAIPVEVKGKVELEKELLSEVPEAPSTSEGTGGKETADKSETGVAAGVAVVAERGAAANEAAPKKAVEKELLSEVKPETSAGEPAPTSTETPTAPSNAVESRDVSPYTSFFGKLKAKFDKQ